MRSVIERIQAHAERIASGDHETVKPGQSVAFTEACAPPDAIRQGDLYLVLVNSPPADYIRVKNRKAAGKQLVPGNTQGSRHCLDSLKGVVMYRPVKWDEESLEGPCFVLTEARTVLHPTHGAVTIPAGFTVLCRYQREYAKELERERRVRD